MNQKELEKKMIECGGTYYDKDDSNENSGGIMISKAEIKRLAHYLSGVDGVF